MQNPVSRTLTYRRAVWTKSSPTLQAYVDSIHGRLPMWSDRIFDYKGSEISSLAFERRNGATYVHLAQCERGRSTSLVPKPDTRKAVDTAELGPPEKNDFLKGDLMFLVRGNHVLICPSGAREAVVSHYIEAATNKLGKPSWITRCSLEPVADLSTLQLIQQEGVKKISLDATLYEATMAYEETRGDSGVRETFASYIAGAFLNLFGEEEELSEIGADENISIELDIKYDKRMKLSKIGWQRMKAISNKLIRESEQDFRIVTGTGKVIEPDELKIKQKHFFDSFGSSVSRQAAWVALGDFFEELERSGALES